MSYHTLDSVSECTASRAGWNVQCVQQQGNSLTVALGGGGVWRGRGQQTNRFRKKVGRDVVLPARGEEGLFI